MIEKPGEVNFGPKWQSASLQLFGASECYLETSWSPSTVSPDHATDLPMTVAMTLQEV